MFANGKSILVQPMQKDDLILNQIDCRIIDVQQKIVDLLTAGYSIYDVASATNNGFNNLIASSSGNRVCIWKSAGSTAYTLLSTELASNGTNVIINAQLNNMNQVTNIRDCKLTCSASSGLFANKAEFYGGDWYLASWTTGSNVKFTNCDVISQSSEVYMPDVNFENCNVRFKRSGTIAYSTYKINTDTRFVNETTAESTASTLTLAYAYTTDSDWFTRCTLVDWQNTGNAVLSSTAQRTFNFTGLKLENADLNMISLYTTEGNKIYYEGQNLQLTGGNVTQAWTALGGNISSSSGTYPSMAIDTNGVQYVAFRDNSTASNGKASCYKYGSTGWSIVGYVGLSSNPMDYINLCISTANDVVIVGRDNSSKATAYKLSAAASSWNLLGSAGFSTNIPNNLKASYYDGFILTAMTNSSQSPFIDHYKYSILTSTEWIRNYYDLEPYSSQIVNFSNISMSKQIMVTNTTSDKIYIQVFYDSNAVGAYYVGYSTCVGISYLDFNTKSTNHDGTLIIVDNTSKLNAYAYNSTDYNNLYLKGSVFSTGFAKYPTINIINGIDYVTIQDTTAKATCYKYVSANSSWNLLGSANFSTENVGRMSMANFNGVPYVAVEEVGAAPGISVYNYAESIVNSNINYNFEHLDTDLFDGEKTLNVSAIQSTANYIVQNCKVRPGYNIVDTAVGRFIRNTYNIELAPGWNPPVDETLKQTNSETFWIVKREDIQDTLNGKIIKNLKLYNSDLSAYTYNSNDNFVIIANNAQKGNGIFCFYNNKIKGTVFSDWYLDSSYTITDCFILMEPNEISELQNVVSSTACTDGPLENGSITFNSYDNEICV